MLDESRRPVPLEEEHTVMTIDHGAEVTLNIPESGGSPKKLTGSGRIWLTEQRVLSSFDSMMVHRFDRMHVAYLRQLSEVRRADNRVRVDPSGVSALNLIRAADVFCELSCNRCQALSWGRSVRRDKGGDPAQGPGHVWFRENLGEAARTRLVHEAAICHGR
jgi:hypothetical protein